MINITLIPLIIPRCEEVELKPLYVCSGCSIHTYSNNMIHMQYTINIVNIHYITTRGSCIDYINAAE
jgi:hypothetical protein